MIYMNIIHEDFLLRKYTTKRIGFSHFNFKNQLSFTHVYSIAITDFEKKNQGYMMLMNIKTLKKNKKHAKKLFIRAKQFILKVQVTCISNSSRDPHALVYFSSARPRAQQTVIRNTLKETGEPALHRSLSQQPTAQSPSLFLSHSSFRVVQVASSLQELTIAVMPLLLAQVLMHLSFLLGQVNSLLLSPDSLSLEQTSSVPMQL